MDLWVFEWHLKITFVLWGLKCSVGRIYKCGYDRWSWSQKVYIWIFVYFCKGTDVGSPNCKNVLLCPLVRLNLLLLLKHGKKLMWLEFECHIPFLHRTSNIDVRYHWIHDVKEKKLMRLKEINTQKNLLNMMTKVVSKEKQKLCQELAGMAMKWEVWDWLFSLLMVWRGRFSKGQARALVRVGQYGHEVRSLRLAVFPPHGLEGEIVMYSMGPAHDEARFFMFWLSLVWRDKK